MTNLVKFVKLTRKAVTPTKWTEKSAGYDLYSTEEWVLQPWERWLFKTGLQLDMPDDVYGRIAPRSWLAYKNWIDVLWGVIDADYNGNVWILLINFGKEKFIVNEGDRIAQIIFEKIKKLNLEETTSIEETQRWSGGFGSTWV